MLKEIISSKQAISVIAMFTIGSSLLFGGGTRLNQDSWLAILLAIVMALPIILIFARLVYINKGMDLFDLVIDVFGKFFGKITCLLYIWYALHLGALVIRNFSEFTQVSSLTKTPKYLIIFLMGFLAVYIVKSGIETMGRWSQMILPVIVFMVLLTVVIGLKDMKLSNILPIMENSVSKISNSAFGFFSFPLAETVLFLAILCSLKPKDSPFKVYFIGILIGAGIILIGALRNIFILGFPIGSDVFFPSHSTSSVISIAEPFSRTEMIISVNLLLNGFIKISVCLMVASKGLAKIFNIEDYRKIVVPTGLFMMAFAYIVYDNITRMTEWFEIYKYYAFPFQVILPIVILIFAEIKHRKTANQQNNMAKTA